MGGGVIGSFIIILATIYPKRGKKTDPKPAREDTKPKKKPKEVVGTPRYGQGDLVIHKGQVRKVTRVYKGQDDWRYVLE